MELSAQLRDLRRLERALEVLRAKSLPYAVRNGLNTAAFAARKHWTEVEMPRVFTLRNKWTAKGVLVERASGTSIDSMAATVGSVRDYADEAELGHTEKKQGKHGVAIPTSGAAGQGKSRSPRTRQVRRANYLQALNVAKVTSGGNRRWRNAQAIRRAGEAGGVAYLDLGRRKGLFRVSGSKRGFRIRMLYDLSRPSVKVPPHPTLEPTMRAIAKVLPDIEKDALIAELRKQRFPGF